MFILNGLYYFVKKDNIRQSQIFKVYMYLFAIATHLFVTYKLTIVKTNSIFKGYVSFLNYSTLNIKPVVKRKCLNSNLEKKFFFRTNKSYAFSKMF